MKYSSSPQGLGFQPTSSGFQPSMGTARTKFFLKNLLAFRTTFILDDRSFLSGYISTGRVPSLPLRSPVYSLVSLSRDCNTVTIHRVSGTCGCLRFGPTTYYDVLTLAGVPSCYFSRWSTGAYYHSYSDQPTTSGGITLPPPRVRSR